MIRFIMDELLPPVIRDSSWFMFPFYFVLYRGRGIKAKMNYKSLVYAMSEKDRNDFAEEIDLISRRRKTDLSENNITHILRSIQRDSRSVVDIGCGKGYLLNRIKEARPDILLFGSDMSNKVQFGGIEFLRGSITDLPYENEQFDTVICTHTIEHIIDLKKAIDELIRITRKQLIIVTPWQRYFYHSFDSHVHFFYVDAELLHYLPFTKYTCFKMNMDWVYIGYKY